MLLCRRAPSRLPYVQATPRFMHSEHCGPPPHLVLLAWHVSQARPRRESGTAAAGPWMPAGAAGDRCTGATRV